MFILFELNMSSHIKPKAKKTTCCHKIITDQVWLKFINKGKNTNVIFLWSWVSGLIQWLIGQMFWQEPKLNLTITTPPYVVQIFNDIELCNTLITDISIRIVKNWQKASLASDLLNYWDSSIILWYVREMYGNKQFNFLLPNFIENKYLTCREI
jgi:hypothetical protein